MRKIMAALLTAASLATPALAQRERDGDARLQAAPERTERPEHRWQGRGGDQGGRPQVQPQQVQQPQSAQQPQPAQAQQAFRQDQRRDWRSFRQDRRDDRQDFRQDRQQDQQAWRNGQFQNREAFRRDRVEDRQAFQQDRTQDWRNFRQDRAQDRRDWQRDRQDWRRDRWQDRNDGRNRGDWQGRDNWRGDHDGAWNRDWRRDPRYNWQDWRSRNRGSYHFPRYYPPRGWGFGYNRFSLGVYLSAPLFVQDYWIDDPYDYRLPPAYGPYRWVRYYDDVMLVDIRNGLVVDVIYDFFW